MLFGSYRFYQFHRLQSTDVLFDVMVQSVDYVQSLIFYLLFFAAAIIASASYFEVAIGFSQRHDNPAFKAAIETGA